MFLTSTPILFLFPYWLLETHRDAVTYLIQFESTNLARTRFSALHLTAVRGGISFSTFVSTCCQNLSNSFQMY